MQGADVNRWEELKDQAVRFVGQQVVVNTPQNYEVWETWAGALFLPRANEL